MSLLVARFAARTSLTLLAGVSTLQVGAWFGVGSAGALPGGIDFSNAIELPAGPEEKFISTDADARTEGAHELIAQIEANWPDDHRRAFLVSVAPRALESAVQHCVPPSVTLGQAILESGWGRSKLAKNHNNLFGVKSGSVDQGVTMTTSEVEQGTRRTRRARFRSYDDWGDSVAHHDRLLAGDPRYAGAREHWENWPLFLKTVAPVYASDPAYVRRVSRLVERYRLDEFDELVSQAARRRANCP